MDTHPTTAAGPEVLARVPAQDAVHLADAASGRRAPARHLQRELLRTDPVAIAESGKGEPDWPAAMVADVEAALHRAAREITLESAGELA